MKSKYSEPDLYSEIKPGLWIGGTDPEDNVNRGGRLPTVNDPKEFDAVVSLDAWSRPFGWYIKEFRYGFPDGGLTPEIIKELDEIACWALSQWKTGSRTLIRCQAGMNRSAFVAALVLGKAGVAAKDSISLIRRKRHVDALSNKYFVEYLEKNY
jgi:hypothetical protein